MVQPLPYAALMPLAPWEAPATVAEALESLRRQTLPPQQVVVSCDGTPPMPLHQCLEASGLPIELVMGPGSEGVGPVLARGLLHCREELVLRVDADDLSLPERAACQVSWMEQQPQVLVMSTPISEAPAAALGAIQPGGDRPGCAMAQSPQPSLGDPAPQCCACCRQLPLSSWF
jgi:hypothetical protein